MLLSADMRLTQPSFQWPLDQAARKLQFLSEPARKVVGYNIRVCPVTSVVL